MHACLQEDFIVHEACTLTHSDSPSAAGASAAEYRHRPWMQAPTLAAQQQRALESTSMLSTASGEAIADALKHMIHSAVVKMQLDVKEELSEEDLIIHGVLGQGAFGTVYHGASPHSAALVHTAPLLASACTTAAAECAW